MKRLYHGMMLAALLSAGCVAIDFDVPDDTPAPPSQALASQKPVLAVRPDQVTQENASDKARALEEELNSDSAAPLPSIGPVTPPANPPQK